MFIYISKLASQLANLDILMHHTHMESCYINKN